MSRLNLFTILLLVLSLLGQSLSLSASTSMKMPEDSSHSMTMEHSVHNMDMDSMNHSKATQMDCCDSDCECAVTGCSLNSCSVGVLFSSNSTNDDVFILSQSIDLYQLPENNFIRNSLYRPPIIL